LAKARFCNHRRRNAPDGLDADLLNLSDGGAKVPKMRNTKYMKGGVEYDQLMQTEESVQRGIKQILTERGRWRPGMLLDCKVCKEKVAHAERAGVAEYSADAKSSQCCARYCLSQEPDFLAQREWLREVVEGAGHEIIFYPK
jgi:hypothetical protein